WIGGAEHLFQINPHRRGRRVGIEQRDDLAQVFDGITVRLTDDRGLARVLRRQQQTFYPPAFRGHGNRQRPAHRTHAPVQRQLADQQNVIQIFAPQISVRAQNAHGYWQVEGRAFLLHVRRGPVDGRFMNGEEEAAVGDRRANSLAAFAHGQVGQPHDGDISLVLRISGSRSQIDFDLYQFGVNAVYRRAQGFKQHYTPPRVWESRKNLGYRGFKSLSAQRIAQLKIHYKPK